MVSGAEFELRSNDWTRKSCSTTFIRTDDNHFVQGGIALVKIELESHSVPEVSAARICLFSAIIFIASHLAFLIGIETPGQIRVR